MDKALLVNVNLDSGGRILEALDEAKIRVNVALWARLSEYQDWRLILAARQLDKAGPSGAYGVVYDALRKAGFTVDDTAAIMILGMKDPFIRELRRVFGGARSVEGMTLGGQSIGDRFVEDAFVYRIS